MSSSDFPAMAILHVVDSLERGGLERVVSDLAIAQLAAGHDVAVFSINVTAGFRAELEEAGVPVLIGGKRTTFDRAVLRALRSAVAVRQVDVVHAHNFSPNYYSAAALFGLRKAVIQVTTCHDMGTRLRERKLRWLYRMSLARTARVAMVSRQVRDHYVASGWVAADRAFTITNGIPVERFRPSLERRQAARAMLGLASSALVIGCVGRLVRIKNHQLLLDCIPALAAKHADLQVVLVGGGELEAELRARVSQAGLDARVRFAGERPDVASLLHAFDIFALPSRSEGLSIALLEASASALAIVATDVGGNSEIVAHDVTGLLVPSGDSAALHDALDGLLSDPARRRTFGDAAARSVAQQASIAAMRRSYDSFYRSALGARALRPRPARKAT